MASNEHHLSPYRNLYVYLMDRPVESRFEAGLGTGFIGNWIEGSQSFLFFSRPSREEVDGLVALVSDLRVMDEFLFTYDEWQGGGLSPARIGPFLIRPPWVGRSDDAEGLELILDPGVVFGNGLHPTTRDCLLALHHVFRMSPCISKVVDLGTGTGILAIASAKLGATRVTAVDLNPLCVKTALRNVGLNGQAGKVSVLEAKAEDHIDVESDLVMANLHCELIEALLRLNGLRKTSHVIISGLLRTKWRSVRHRLLTCGFQIKREWDHEMTWFTILAIREAGLLEKR